jgi:hypothetical protein
MKDSQLYKAIEAGRLSEMDRCVAMAAIERGERFADAVMWLVRGIRKLRSKASRQSAPSYHEPAKQGRAF